MGCTPKKRTSTQSGEVKLNEIVYWMASTFGWTLNTIYNVELPELNYIVQGANEYVSKQNKEIEKSSKSSKQSGKYTVDNLSQLKTLPGVKVVKRK